MDLNRSGREQKWTFSGSAKNCRKREVRVRYGEKGTSRVTFT